MPPCGAPVTSGFGTAVEWMDSRLNRRHEAAELTVFHREELLSSRRPRREMQGPGMLFPQPREGRR